MNFAMAVQALCDQEVEFIIAGGWSAILHGSSHVTNDIDIFYARATDNLKRLVQALSPYHPRLRDVATLRNTTLLTLTTDLGPIDLLAEIAGLGPFEQVSAGAMQVEAFGRTVRTLDLESLIKSKRAAGREKDLRVLPELESLREAEEM
jgi:predicted nucleotidyltransferase